MRSAINYCLCCARLIPVQESDMSPAQIKTRKRLEAAGVRWPKAAPVS